MHAQNDDVMNSLLLQYVVYLTTIIADDIVLLINFDCVVLTCPAGNTSKPMLLSRHPVCFAGMADPTRQDARFLRGSAEERPRRSDILFRKLDRRRVLTRDAVNTSLDT